MDIVGNNKTDDENTKKENHIKLNRQDDASVLPSCNIAITERTERIETIIDTLHSNTRVNSQREIENCEDVIQQPGIHSFNSNGTIDDRTGIENLEECCQQNDIDLVISRESSNINENTNDSLDSNTRIDNNSETENREDAIQQHDIHSFNSNGSIDGSTRIENLEERYQQSDINRLASDTLHNITEVDNNNDRENHVDAFQQQDNDSFVPDSNHCENESDGYANETTDDTVTKAYNNLIQEINGNHDKCRLLTFIKELILEWLRKLKKYICIRSGSENASLGKVEELLNFLDIAIDNIMKANQVTPTTLNVAVKEIYRGGINKTNTHYKRRKARKICKLFSHKIDNNDRRLHLQRSLLAITIVACDICRMYEQQIYYISDGNDDYDLLKFVKDCVERMTRSIHYRQGRFGIFSRIWDAFAHSLGENNAINEIRTYKGTEIDQAEQIRQFTEYIIYGLWKSADHKIVRRCVSGRQIYVKIDGKLYKITCGNLLRRVKVKIDDKIYFPNWNDGPIRRFVGKIPVRLNNHSQDKITKKCGYRLKSLIIPFKNDNFDELSTVPSNDASFPKILCNINNFEELEKLAMLLSGYFNINTF